MLHDYDPEYAGLPPVDVMSAHDLGALLAGKARRVDKPCLQCRALMNNVTVRREFCSPRCRQKHWRDRLFGLKPGESMVYVNHRREPERRPEPDAPSDLRARSAEDPTG